MIFTAASIKIISKAVLTRLGTVNLVVWRGITKYFSFFNSNTFCWKALFNYNKNFSLQKGESAKRYIISMYIVSYTTSGLFRSHIFSKLISKYVLTSLYLQIISICIAQSLKVMLKCWLRTASTSKLVNNITIIVEFLDHRYLKFIKEFNINSDSYINRLLSTLERNSNNNFVPSSFDIS